MTDFMTPEVKAIHDRLLNRDGYEYGYIDDDGVIVFYKPLEAVGLKPDASLILNYPYVEHDTEYNNSELDGAARNLSKSKVEFQKWWPAVKSTWADFVSPGRGTGFHHDFTDMFKEPREASPYFSAKVATVSWLIGLPSYVFFAGYFIKSYFVL